MRPILILRPQPGAGRTQARAAALGLEYVVASIFTLRPLDWTSPDPVDHDAILLTSANAVSLAGDGLKSFLALPCYAVGEATAAAAQAVGFSDLRIGPSDVGTLLGLMADDGVRRALHLSGRDHRPAAEAGITLTRIPVYAADPVDALPAQALEALRLHAVVLLHSPRAAAHFAVLADRARLARDALDLVAISPAAAAAAGGGWRSKQAADKPRDEALLELAAKLCKTGFPARAAGGRG
jgi:uroporphyrinogen-III synthase